MKNSIPTVAVLLSTYNGEKYIREQIESILNQKNVEILLCIRDDGSKDNTIDIIKQYCLKYNGKITAEIGKNVGWKKVLMKYFTMRLKRIIMRFPIKMMFGCQIN